MEDRTEQRTEEHGETYRSQKRTDYSHHPTAFVLIAEIGTNNAENEGASKRRYLVMTFERHVAPWQIK